MRARRERFTVEEVLRTGIQLASAVETAHRAGIIHRDIKPANVLVSQYGAPGLTDFGIAGQLGHGVALDEDDDVGVSVPWAPPEVLFGQTNGDARADVYSLAATLWQLLVGRSPFEVPGGDNTAYALMPRIRSSPVPSTGRADVPVSLERLLSLAMSKDPAARPATALALARALQEVEQEQRFPRTAMVVLDEQGQTTLADHSGPRPGDADEDRTRVRSPKAVHAQGPAPARPAPAAYPSPLSGSTSIPAASTTPVSTNHAAGSPATTGLHDGLADEGTVRVDRSRARQAAEGPEPAGAAAAGPRPQVQISPAVVLGVVGGLVLALVARRRLGARGTRRRPAAGPHHGAAHGRRADRRPPEHPADPCHRGAGPGRRRCGSAGPTRPRRRRDTFRLRVAPTAQALGEARYQVAKDASRTVKAAKGRQVCAQVQVVRSGTSSIWSDPACEKAG